MCEKSKIDNHHIFEFWQPVSHVGKQINKLVFSGHNVYWIMWIKGCGHKCDTNYQVSKIILACGCHVVYCVWPQGASYKRSKQTTQP